MNKCPNCKNVILEEKEKTNPPSKVCPNCEKRFNPPTPDLPTKYYDYLRDALDEAIKKHGETGAKAAYGKFVTYGYEYLREAD